MFLTVVLGAVLVLSIVMTVRQQLQYRENAASYTQAAHLAQFHPPKTAKPSAPAGSRAQQEEQQEQQEEEKPLTLAQALEAIDLTALQEKNPDVKGWIYIPDTELSYPLLYGKNNDFYLYRGWDKTRNNCGSIFFDFRCSASFEDFNTVIYGHRMRNDSMFGTLKYYQTEEFWQDHPTIYIVDASGVRQYDIFAAWEPSVTSPVYSMDYGTQGQRQEFLDACLAGNQLNTGIVPGPEDKILTLSTCTGKGHATRWVVQGVERPPEAE